MRHLTVPAQGRWLGEVVRGYLAHHVVQTNPEAITTFVHYVIWHWKRALRRRSSSRFGRPAIGLLQLGRGREAIGAKRPALPAPGPNGTKLSNCGTLASIIT
jgi:hypothetical protein